MDPKNSSHDLPANLTDNQPRGPVFIDDELCECALQEQLGKQAWKCFTNETADELYVGQTGKWFFAVNQTNAALLRDPINSDSNPPDLDTPYVIDGQGPSAAFVKMTSKNDTKDPDDAYCTGKNDTEASSTLYTFLAAYAITSPSPCWQPGTVARLLQSASAWNATGCSLGFLCKCSRIT